MRITVILCTYNRCESLSKALESAAALRVISSPDWEVLVVDNNSRDRTLEVVQNFCRRFPGRFRYLFETRQGKSFALNAGIQAAHGDLVAFMDDDVTVEPEWLQNLTSSLDGTDWSGAGGRILPQWISPPPPWLPRHDRRSLAPFALFDLGLKAGELTEPPFGTNMAFRKVMFEKYGGFRTDLGPNPNNLIRGEDTEFGRRLLAAGERLRYEPAAVVHHPVPAERLRKDYFLAWWFDKGRSDIRENGIEPNHMCYQGIPLVLWRRLALWTLRWIVTSQSSLRFENKIKAWVNAGMIAECYRQFRATDLTGSPEPKQEYPFSIPR